MCILKDIPGYEGRYMASTEGHIWGCVKGDYLSERTEKNGYKIVHLYCRGRKKNYFVHRLVAMTFIPNPENKATVNHINEIKSDNRVENLEWMTNLENIYYGTGRERAWLNNITSRMLCKKVAQLSLDGKIIKIHRSIKRAALSVGVDKKRIKMCLKGIYKTCHGYRWQLAE